jgi:hypothetical protein
MPATEREPCTMTRARPQGRIRLIAPHPRVHRVLFNNPVSFVFDAKFSSEMS